MHRPGGEQADPVAIHDNGGAHVLAGFGVENTGEIGGTIRQVGQDGVDRAGPEGATLGIPGEEADDLAIGHCLDEHDLAVLAATWSCVDFPV